MKSLLEKSAWLMAVALLISGCGEPQTTDPAAAGDPAETSMESGSGVAGGVLEEDLGEPDEEPMASPESADVAEPAEPETAATEPEAAPAEPEPVPMESEPVVPETAVAVTEPATEATPAAPAEPVAEPETPAAPVAEPAAEPVAASAAAAGDWSMWGGTPSRNMVNAATGRDFSFDPEAQTNLVWSAPLGSQT